MLFREKKPAAVSWRRPSDQSKRRDYRREESERYTPEKLGTAHRPGKQPRNCQQRRGCNPGSYAVHQGRRRAKEISRGRTNRPKRTNVITKGRQIGRAPRRLVHRKHGHRDRRGHANWIAGGNTNAHAERCRAHRQAVWPVLTILLTAAGCARVLSLCHRPEIAAIEAAAVV